MIKAADKTGNTIIRFVSPQVRSENDHTTEE